VGTLLSRQTPERLPEGNAPVSHTVLTTKTEPNGVHLTSPPSKRDPSPDLIRKAQAGDRESLKALLREIEPPVRQWALAHAGDPDSAADLCQEVFLLLLRKLGSYRGDARFLTWLFAVTRNQALEATRRLKRHERKMSRFKVETAGRSPGARDEGSTLDRERLKDLVGTFVRDLPARQREVFQLADLQGLSSPEIGSILNLKPGTVRVALLKARRTLRKKILENHPEFVEEYLT
jgi:RNA polymerase sigma-70 factor (ECF subfamily)